MRFVLFLLLFSSIVFGVLLDENKSNSNIEISNSSNVELTDEEMFLAILINFKENVFAKKGESELDSEKVYLNKIINFINKQDHKIILGQNLDDDINKLRFKIKTNSKYGYDLAIKRDEIKISTISNRILFYQLINELIVLRIKYADKNKMKEVLSIKYSSFESNDIKKYSEEYGSINLKKEELTPVEAKYKEYYEQYYQEKSLFLYITKYLENNIDIIHKSNFIKEKINLDYLVFSIDNYLNLNEIINNLNYAIKYTTKVSIGNILIAIFAAGFIYILRFIILPIVSNIVVSNFKDKNDNDIKLQDLLINTLEKPLKYLLIIIGLDVFIKLLHNNQFNIDLFNSFFTSSYTFVFVWVIYNFIDKGLDVYSNEIFNKYPNLRTEMVLFTKRIFVSMLFITFISVSLSSFGVNLMALGASLGVLGIGVGLAFKDVFGHFFGSIMILIDKPFSPGDWIVYSDGEGTVIEIGMRGTRIRTFANAEIMVPNSSLSNGTILNWSKRELGRRIKLDIGITYESPKEGFKQLILDLRNMLETHPDIANNSTNFNSKTRKQRESLVNKENDLGIKKTLFVHFETFADSSKLINVYCFTKTVDWGNFRDVKEDVLFKIEDLVYKNNCEFAYNTVKTHLSFDDSYMELKQIENK